MKRSWFPFQIDNLVSAKIPDGGHGIAVHCKPAFVRPSPSLHVPACLSALRAPLPTLPASRPPTTRAFLQ